MERALSWRTDRVIAVSPEEERHLQARTKSGQRLERDDVDTLARAIDQMLSGDPRTYAAAARAAGDRYTADRMTAEALKVIDELIG